MNHLLYSEWLILKTLQLRPMDLQELHRQTRLEKSLIMEVLQNLIKIQYVFAARGLFRAQKKVDSNPRFEAWGETMVMMINETYKTSLGDSVPTSA